MNQIEIQQLDLNLLVALSVMLEEASLTNAGRRLGRTPSAMSHALGRLREAFDDPLFVRSGHRLVPTPGALALREPLQGALEGIAALLRRPTCDPARMRRRFRVVATDYLQLVTLPPLMQRLRAEAPGVDLEILPVHRRLSELLASDGADLALGVSLTAPEGLKARTIGTDRFICVARPERWTCGEDPEAFAALPHALVAPIGWPGGPVDVALANLGLRRRVVLTLPSFMAAFALVAAGDLVLTAPERLARLLAPPELLLAPPPIPLEPYRLLALWHPRVDAEPEHRWLRERLGSGLDKTQS